MNQQQKLALSLLAGAFPQAISGDAGFSVWSGFLAAVPAEVLTAVIREWITTEDRPPTIASILARVEAIEGFTPEAAWQEVCSILMSRRWDSAGFTCEPRMLAGVRCAGGWQQLRFMENDERPFRKREFVEGWKAYQQRSGALALMRAGAFKEVSDGNDR